MSDAWQRVHRRYELAEEVLGRVRRARSVEAVVERWLPHLEREFGALDGFLQHVQRQWYSRLAVRLDTVLDPDGTDEDPRRIWRELAEDEPALRRVLAAYAGHPALEHGDRVNSALTRRATGFSVAELAAAAEEPVTRWTDRLPCVRLVHRWLAV